MKLNPCVSPCTKINSKWMNDVNVNPKSTGRKHRYNPRGYRYRKRFFWEGLSNSRNNWKYWQVGVNEINKFSHSWRNQKGKVTFSIIEEKLWKLLITDRINIYKFQKVQMPQPSSNHLISECLNERNWQFSKEDIQMAVNIWKNISNLCHLANVN